LVTCTQGAISLGSSRNLQGAQKILNLKTGEVIVWCSYTKVPMPDKVIEQVNFLGQNQPELITFANCHGYPIGDHDPNIPQLPEHNAAADNGDGDDNIPGVPADNVKLPGVDQGDDNQLPDIFEVGNNDQQLENPKPEFNIDEPNNIPPDDVAR
jgi:hypothetical protein